jgi:hypothetical protein
MPTNPYFNNFDAINEQTVLEDLIIEAIQMYGHNCFYLPRTLLGVDPIFGEEEVSQFNSAIETEMYIMNVEGFGGDGEFLSRFNIEIRDRLTFAIARRRFNEDIAGEIGNPRPREGDVIYFPMTGGYYEIKFVEQEKTFYQLGKLNVYQLVCEMFEYSDEQFNTGNPTIDRIEGDYSTVVEIDDLVDNDGNFILTAAGDRIKVADTVIDVQDPSADNDDLEDEAAEIIDFSISNPFSEDFT